MSTSYGTDDGAAIHRIRTAPHLSQDHQRLSHYELIVNAETTTSVSPTWYLTYSDNKGGSWATEKSVTTAAGFVHEPHFRRMGAARDRIYQLRTDVNSCPSLIESYLNLSQASD